MEKRIGNVGTGLGWSLFHARVDFGKRERREIVFVFDERGKEGTKNYMSEKDIMVSFGGCGVDPQKPVACAQE